MYSVDVSQAFEGHPRNERQASQAIRGTMPWGLWRFMGLDMRCSAYPAWVLFAKDFVGVSPGNVGRVGA